MEIDQLIFWKCKSTDIPESLEEQSMKTFYSWNQELL
jgi:hypothetical protein